MNARTCRCTAKTGLRCKNRVKQGKLYCYFHKNCENPSGLIRLDEVEDLEKKREYEELFRLAELDSESDSELINRFENMDIKDYDISNYLTPLFGKDINRIIQSYM
jgi:prolyl oligopeptidase PreP (S9A serine peptidase family)